MDSKNLNTKNIALVIFGSTGDLMYKKLIPALNQLIKKNNLTKTSKIYAIGRKPFTLSSYIEHAKTRIKETIDWIKLEALMEYVILDVDEPTDYQKLSDKVHQDGFNNIAIYLAVPPNLFPVIAKGVHRGGLIKKPDKHARIVFEKPFGEDIKSAKQINKSLSHYFDESQIYRIDHYLGKEMIQNILVVRFANKLFQNAWNNKTIKRITILAKESEGVNTRGAYYDNIGALKDMLQSHLLQMASLITMDKPKSFKSTDLKDEKVKALKALKFDASSLLLGQYDGYRKTDNVDPNSNTETFVYVEAKIVQGTLKDVPIQFITGKALNEKRSEIIVYFNDDKDIKTLFPNLNQSNNKLTIKVAPEEGVSFQLNVKEPGLNNTIVPAELDYCHSCRALENIPEAYEKLFLELLNEKRTLFTRWDEAEATWSLMENLHSSDDKLIYKTYQDILDVLKPKGVDIHDL